MNKYQPQNHYPMKNYSKVFAVAAVLLLFSCGANKESSPFSESALAKDQARLSSPEAPPTDEGQKNEKAGSAVDKMPEAVFERKLIKTGDVSFKTKSLSDTKKQITEALKTAVVILPKKTHTITVKTPPRIQQYVCRQKISTLF